MKYDSQGQARKRIVALKVKLEQETWLSRSSWNQKPGSHSQASTRHMILKDNLEHINLYLWIDIHGFFSRSS